jgi:hypothetical protein
VQILHEMVVALFDGSLPLFRRLPDEKERNVLVKENASAAMALRARNALAVFP